MLSRVVLWSPVLALALCASLVGNVLAAPPKAVPAKTVELFSAIEQGEIEVRVVPRDSTQCRVLINNKTTQPLSVKLPDAFAAVPVLAQLAGGAGGGTSTSTTQAVGGGGGGMFGGGGGGGGGGLFNVAPEQVGHFQVATVCLEHGKADPQPHIPYQIKPLESVAARPEMREVCKMLASGKLPQRVAQAAAWHLNNNMSWEQLAGKQIHTGGSRLPYFSPVELRAALQAVAVAAKAVESQKPASSGSSYSGS